MSRSPDGSHLNRRGFLKGAGLTAAAVTVTGKAAIGGIHQDGEVTILGPGPTSMKLRINGADYVVNAEPFATLLDVLRDWLDLTGSKRVCNRGFCGACTVHVNGRTVNACSMLAIDAVRQDIRTIEGIAGADGELAPIQQAFIDCDATQCGFCTPGMIMACTGVLERNPKPSRDEVRAGISGNICRCGTYQNIFEAVDQASGQVGGGK